MKPPAPPPPVLSPVPNAPPPPPTINILAKIGDLAPTCILVLEGLKLKYAVVKVSVWYTLLKNKLPEYA